MCLINIDDIDWKKGKKQILQKGPCLKIPVQNSRSQLKCLVHVQKHEMQGEHHVEMKQKQNVLSVNLSLSVEYNWYTNEVDTSSFRYKLIADHAVTEHKICWLAVSCARQRRSVAVMHCTASCRGTKGR
ncbi:hypothetical protein FOQG_15215 [Fusarium oxysporum f. sp. raphani 54005]|uniref:Uncharacterized protein n=4 Tax=Fusarium oxysporum TaxID=5507 RepID=X0BN03_FUSOX|nr:hypothetical protein FOVG_04759 [Fusarium oxysporum f. sp. pisi HDV247]EXK80273.1 hypothetical protein FOQG_15215 [Fusarium oxysporum f. sp. raphani 54005]EXL87467.1 hypothetical protein FOPG_01664 [Fusarium oxysporum f. sp. conglutinans race 2 54008]EXM25228.1 hypothetical protein FOTG_07747 [Fusarium oxysporum f. sp. vasinfectum 25433]EXA47744.1 hypothetical protein FOVG_04759 [Fusarium oxysporum f. sp. pisi HDV247]